MEFDAYFRERILINDFLIFKVVEESFQTGDFPFNAFDFVMTVQVCDISTRFIKWIQDIKKQFCS